MPGWHFSLKRKCRHTQLQSAIDMTDQTQILSKHHLNPSLPKWLEKFKDRKKNLHAAHLVKKDGLQFNQDSDSYEFKIAAFNLFCIFAMSTDLD